MPMDHQTFSLEGKGLKWDSREDMEPYLVEFDKQPVIKVIHLSGNTLGVEASKALSEHLKKRTTIEAARLSDVFTGRLLQEIPASLTVLNEALLLQTQLIELDLSDNAFGPVGAKPLADFLIKNKTLKELFLNNNGLGPQGGKMIADALATHSNHPLEVLVIGRNRLENVGAEALSKAFASLSNLRRLGIPQNGIRPEGIKMLSESIFKCVKIEWIDFQDNTFTDSASYGFATALKPLANLKHLNIGDCLLGPKGSVSVIQSLLDKETCILEVLNLQYNEINENCAMLVAKLVERMKGLKSLYLNGNTFNPDGLAASAIRKNLERNGLDECVLDEWDDNESEEEEEEQDEGQEEETEEEKQLESTLENLKI